MWCCTPRSEVQARRHPNRLQIVNILLQGELNVGEIQRVLSLKQTITSNQLFKL